MTNLGPGTLRIGPSEAQIDVSCLINNVRISSSKNQDDPTYKLCGTATPGRIVYTYSISGNMDVDVATDSGLFAYSQDHAGEQVAFEFVPNTTTATAATGTIVIDPLDFGGDDYGAVLDSDFEFSVIGKPTYTYPGA